VSLGWLRPPAERPVVVLASAATSSGAGPTVVRHRVYLHPGQLHAAAEPTEVTTVLGSCVAVCLWDPEARIGGVNHYTLPAPLGGSAPSPRFGEAAIEMLVQQVVALGGRGHHLQAKVCGGGNAFGKAGGLSLGQKNVDVARERLAAHGIAVVAVHVGGTRGRKLIFQTDTGIAWVKRL
jgi:chemotaxis protein CheD